MTDLPQNMPQVRLKFISYDARRQPKTSRWCICCQRDLKPNETSRLVYVTGDYQAIHPCDLNDREPQPSDIGWKLLGLSCARRLGLAWTIKSEETGAQDTSGQKQMPHASASPQGFVAQALPGEARPCPAAAEAARDERNIPKLERPTRRFA
ncbi:MAG TPA: hypothetical protein VME69_11930 [Methylocella sp.]|nr:hypothetical protein [Methylocella sp.]